MDDLDLDSFIANIEQTAPEENLGSKLTCKECDVPLEEGEDGNYVCPNCSAQATGILQLDETELHHDEQGRPVFGQRVRTTERIRKHRTEYGWAWSTDDAVAHILGLQVDALEKAKLLPEFFRPAIANMWLKFWIEHIAPHIKDTYDENELIPVSSRKALKVRDIEVLVKVRDKVMVPAHLIQLQQDGTTAYKMYGASFLATNPEDKENDKQQEDDDLACKMTDDTSSINSSSSLDDIDLPPQLDEQQADNELNATQPLEQVQATDPSIPVQEGQPAAGAATITKGKRPSTRNLTDESIAILTLNRTLAFIEATARCMNQNDPLFAADIIRACNQRLIPFYDASRHLPNGMNLNLLDKLMFQRTKPPTPIQLTRAASLLIHRIYQDQLPKTLPTPNLSAILERFIKDLNLPYELHDLIKDVYTFSDFQQTRPMVFKPGCKRRLPQYDRWAFAVLIFHLKRLFNLTDAHLILQGERAQMESRDKNEFYFDINSWVQQLSLRLQLILRYDPFVLLHPMAEVEKLECTPQLSKYINLIIDDRPTATTRSQPNAPQFDEAFRAELSDFINRQLPLPEGADKSMLADEELDKSSNIKYPMTDAYERTQRLWADQIEEDREMFELVHKSFGAAKLLLPGSLPMWCIYDKGPDQYRWKLEISSEWPHAFKLLLNVGAFLCFCEPVELVNEVRLVEERLLAPALVIRRTRALNRKVLR